MKRVLAAALLSLWPISAGSLLLSGEPRTYYFNAAGSNSNDCLTTATACQTIAKANTFTLAPCDRILFHAGDNFNTAGAGLSLRPGPNAACPAVVAAYGSGAAPTITIANDIENAISGTSGYYYIQGLTLIGPGTCAVYCAGINFDVNGALGDVGSLTFKNITARGFTNCIDIGGGTVGADGYFNDVQIIDPNTSNCGLFGIGTYGNETETDDFHVKSLTLINATTCDIPGTSAFNPAGSSAGGVTFKRVQVALVVNLTTCRIGVRGAGGLSGVGLQTIQSDQIVVRDSRCFEVRMTTDTNNDGMCWDFDSGTTNSLFEYLVAQDADGHGLIACQSPALTLSPHSNNVARYNFLLDNNKLLTNDGGQLALACGGTFTSFHAYNNTLYSSTTNGTLIDIALGTYTDIQISNHIVYGAATPQLLLNVDGNPAGISFTGNDWVAAGGSTNKFRWNGVNYTTFAAWQTATGQEKIAGSNVGFTSDPLMVSASTSAQLQSSSPMRGTGINLFTQYGIDQGSSDLYGNGIPSHIGTGYNVGADGR